MMSKHDDMIITWLLPAACDIAINKTPSFSDSLTVDEVRKRRSSKFSTRHHSIHCQVHSGLCSTASIMMLSSHCAVLTMISPLSSYTNYSSPVSVTSFRKNMDFIVRSLTTKKGWPRFVSSISCLVLRLAWTRTHGSLSVCLKFSKCIFKVLQTNENAIVRIPTTADKQQSHLVATMINQKYQIIRNFLGAMDCTSCNNIVFNFIPHATSLKQASGKK